MTRHVAALLATWFVGMTPLAQAQTPPPVTPPADFDEVAAGRIREWAVQHVTIQPSVGLTKTAVCTNRVDVRVPCASAGAVRKVWEGTFRASLQVSLSKHANAANNVTDMKCAAELNGGGEIGYSWDLGRVSVGDTWKKADGFRNGALENEPTVYGRVACRVTGYFYSAPSGYAVFDVDLIRATGGAGLAPMDVVATRRTGTFRSLP